MGAGPYRLKSWESGSRLTLVASPTYFQGRPHIDEVIYRVIPDSGTMFMEARSGRIDLMGLSPEQYLCQTNTPWWEKNFHKYRYLASVYVYLGFNMDHPFFKDVRVRRAISMAISREDLVKGALLGQGVPAIGPYKPGTAFFHPTLKPVKQTVTEARRLLREAGFEDRDGDGILEKDGKPFAFTILTNQGNSERILVSIIIQNQLRRVGIDVRVRTVEWAAFIREFVNKGLFDALVLGWTVTPDPDIYQVWHSSQAVPGGLNFMHFRNKELDSLLEEGTRHPGSEAPLRNLLPCAGDSGSRAAVLLPLLSLFPARGAQPLQGDRACSGRHQLEHGQMVDSEGSAERGARALVIRQKAGKRRKNWRNTHFDIQEQNYLSEVTAP